MPNPPSGAPDAGDSEAAPPGRAPEVRRLRRASVRLFARLPRPARLLWIFLAVLGGVAVTVHIGGLGLASLVALPLVGAGADLLFQHVRFRSFRMPDAALGTGFLLALLLPPTVRIVDASVVAFAAITVRHAIRYRERPLLNPAATGVLIGVLALGMAPAWWGSIDVVLVVALGILLTLRSPGSWRIPVAFLATYAALTPLANLVIGEAIAPQLLLLQALDPSMLFFGLFMVTEPRTAPTKAGERWFFGLYVGVATVFLPAIFPSLAPFVALLFGDVVAVVMRAVKSPVAVDARANRRAIRRARRQGRTTSAEAWGTMAVGHRVAAGAAAFGLLAVLVIASSGISLTPSATLRPSTNSVPVGVSRDCSKDNPSVAADTLSYLHQRLGPSVVLSVDQNTGVVVFYDPVNKATITETDMYEDFGYAEFNGDDYAVLGCSP